MTVPATIATAIIKTESDWQNYLIYKTNTEAIDGYFVLDGDISATALGTAVKPASALDGSVGFKGVLDGRGHTLTIANGCKTGVGIFGVLGNGSVVKNLNIVNNSGLAPGWNSNVLLGSVASKARVENVTIVINGANHTSGTRYGALTHDGMIDCTFVNTEFKINGAVQSLSGGDGNNAKVGLVGTSFIDCTVTLGENSSLGEVGHKGSAVFVYKGATAQNGETVLSGISLRSADYGEYLLKNDNSDYKIVLPQGSSATLTKAADELVKYFAEATGVTLDKIYDSADMIHGKTQAYLSLGNTTLCGSANLGEVNLKTNGYRLQTKDKNVYITGGSYKGVLQGVYGLLKDLFGLEFYSEDCYEIIGASEIVRPDYDEIFNPDINLRAQTGIVLGSDEKFSAYADHLQINDYIWAHLMPIVKADDESKTDYGHNAFYYLPPDTYKTSHPNFYSDQSNWKPNTWGGINAQLCYTARGNSSDYAEMVRLCAERIENSLEKYSYNTTYDAVMLGMEDNYYTCKCLACQEVISKYGALSATVILFLDDVASKVEEWMIQNPQYARDLQYTFFAYQTMLKAPSVMPRVKNKIVPLVALSEMNHTTLPTDTTERTHAYSGTLSNGEILSWTKQWGDFAISNGGNAWAWTYGNFYRDYFAFYDSYTFYGEIFKYLKDYGYGLCYVQQQSKQRNAYTAFYSLNQYVTAKLAANSALNTDDLINDYMSAMYKDAAPAMKELFDKWRSVFSSRLSLYPLGYDGKIGANFTYDDISGMLNILDNAYAAIAKYETADPELYAAIKRRIDLEWLSPAKIALVGSDKIKSVAEQKSRYESIRTKFKKIVSETGIAAASEFNDIKTLLDEIDSITI